MAGGYARVRRPMSGNEAAHPGNSANTRRLQVNAHDDDDVDTPTAARSTMAVPNSPPPSFHSRASSPSRRNQVNPDLADAFDDDEDDSDNEADDRQRLVRQNSTPAIEPSSGNAAASSHAPSYTPPALAASSTPRPTRVMGGGNGTDGVFANMSARPERVETEKDEQPPVRLFNYLQAVDRGSWL
jgi:hypothetical protein